MRKLLVAISCALTLAACGDSREEQLAKQVQQLQQQNRQQQQALENAQYNGAVPQAQMAPQAQPNNITVQQSAPAQSHDSGMKDMLIGGAIGAMAGHMMSGGSRSSHSTETRVVEREVYRPAPSYNRDVPRSSFGNTPSTPSAPVSPAIGSAVKPVAPVTPNFSAPNTPKPSAPVIPSYKVNAPAFTPSKPSGAYSSGVGSSYKSSSPTPSVSYKSSPAPSRSFSSGKR